MIVPHYDVTRNVNRHTPVLLRQCSAVLQGFSLTVLLFCVVANVLGLESLLFLPLFDKQGTY